MLSNQTPISLIAARIFYSKQINDHHYFFSPILQPQIESILKKKIENIMGTNSYTTPAHFCDLFIGF